MSKSAFAFIVLGLAVLVGLGVLGLKAANGIGGGWETLQPFMPIVVVGLLIVGVVTGGLMWLAFYSSRHGYDERVEYDVRDE